MIKKLTKHGNSLALVIDKPVLDLLEIDSETPLSITTDGTCLVLSPIRDPKHQARFRKAVAEGNNRYAKALKRLADWLSFRQVGFSCEFLHADLFEMAAAYLFHIVKNHPFVDGNKRAGAMSAYVFLQLNGLNLQASNESFEGIVRAVAVGKADKGKADKGRVAEFFRVQTGK
jgi:death-on-curing family protein